MFVLASTSPRRRDLIKLFGIPFNCIDAAVDESPRGDEPPEKMVERLSRAKANVGARIHPEAFVVGADTVVALDGRTLGKPKDADDAAQMLKQLSGRSHFVYSGVTAVRGKGMRSLTSRTAVWMRAYSDEEIARFVSSGEAIDKAAGYSIQDRDFHPVAHIEGCYANVMGLPLCHLYLLLQSFGIQVAEPDQACQTRLNIICPVAEKILNSDL